MAHLLLSIVLTSTNYIGIYGIEYELLKTIAKGTEKAKDDYTLPLFDKSHYYSDTKPALRTKKRPRRNTPNDESTKSCAMEVPERCYEKPYQTGKCHQRKIGGDIYRRVTRWSFDKKSSKCHSFFWSCHGNNNIFTYECDCQKTCEIPERLKRGKLGKPSD